MQIDLEPCSSCFGCDLCLKSTRRGCKEGWVCGDVPVSTLLSEAARFRGRTWLHMKCFERGRHPPLGRSHLSRRCSAVLQEPWQCAMMQNERGYLVSFGWCCGGEDSCASQDKGLLFRGFPKEGRKGKWAPRSDLNFIIFRRTAAVADLWSAPALMWMLRELLESRAVACRGYLQCHHACPWWVACPLPARKLSSLYVEKLLWNGVIISVSPVFSDDEL